MKESWRKRLPKLDWKKGSQTAAGLTRSIGSTLQATRFGNPIRSVGTKLSLLFITSILICVLALGLVSYNLSKSIIEKKVAEAGSQTAVQTAGKLDLLLNGYERQTIQFLTDSKFMSLLQNLSILKDDYQLLITRQDLHDRLSQVVMADFALEAVHLVPLNPDLPFITTGSNIDPGGIRALPYIKQIEEGKGRPVWIPTQAKGLDGQRNEPTFGIGRYLNQGTPAILLMEIRYKTLKDAIGDIQFGEKGSVYVVSQDGMVVFADDVSKLGGPYGNKIPETSAKVRVDGVNSLSNVGLIELTEWKLIGNIPVSELIKDARAIQNLTLLIAGIAVLFAAGIGLWIMQAIGKPLAELSNLMDKGKKGILTVRSQIRKKDEIGQVAESFNSMMEEITGLVQRTNQSALEVLETAAMLSEASRKTADAAKEIAVATEEIAGGATNLAIESEKGSDMTSQIGVQVQSVITSNGEMGQAAGEVEAAGRRGSEYMGTLIQKTGQTEEMTRSMVDKVDKLKESTRSIRKILDVLGNVSKQTNILSLNATIEAARAGAAGKGFMVVADEIRKLADQSKQSIDVVGGIVETIQREIDETVSVLSEAYPIFQEQIDSVREANEIFVAVQQNMNSFISRLESATESVRQLEEAQSALSMAMTNVSAVAQQASATSEEVASLSSEQLGISDGLVQLSNRLETVSNQLRDSLSRFTVN